MVRRRLPPAAPSPHGGAFAARPGTTWSAAHEHGYQAALQRLRVTAQQFNTRLLQQLVAQRVRSLLAAGQHAAASGADPLLVLCAAARLIERAQLWREQQQQAAAQLARQPGTAPAQELLNSGTQQVQDAPRPAKRLRASMPPRP